MKTEVTSKAVASKAGALLGLSRKEFMDAFALWHSERESTPSNAQCAAWAWYYVVRRARSVAGSALRQGPKRKRGAALLLAALCCVGTMAHDESAVTRTADCKPGECMGTALAYIDDTITFMADPRFDGPCTVWRSLPSGVVERGAIYSPVPIADAAVILVVVEKFKDYNSGISYAVICYEPGCSTPWGHRDVAVGFKDAATAAGWLECRQIDPADVLAVATPVKKEIVGTVETYEVQPEPVRKTRVHWSAR